MRKVPHVPNGTRHIRLIQKVATYLAEVGPRNSRQILEYINTNTGHGTTRHELFNVMAKTPYFRKLEIMERVSGMHHSGSYNIEVWDITEAEESE